MSAFLDIPTLTGVFPSSSNALLLPPGLLFVPSRLKLLVVLVNSGRCGDGVCGGELAIVLFLGYVQRSEMVVAACEERERE